MCRQALKPITASCSLVFAALSLVGALSAEAADTLTVTGTDTFEVMPTPVPLASVDGIVYLASFSVAITPTDVAPAFSAPVGAVNMTAPPRNYLLSSLVGHIFPCGAGGTCMVVSVAPSSLPTDDIGPFPVTLSAPLPDLDGDCTNVSGQVDGAWGYTSNCPRAPSLQ